MSTLLDTNLLTRLVNPAQPMHQAAIDAVAALRLRNESLHLVPQNFYEFWSWQLGPRLITGSD